VVSIRKQYKVVNYSAVYGVGPPKLARELKSSVTFAKQLLEGYWKRNWAVRKVAEDCVVKTVNGQKWLFNPVSKFWYSLRYEKDRFSTQHSSTTNLVVRLRRASLKLSSNNSLTPSSQSTTS
jgi:hypothetical protein